METLVVFDSTVPRQERQGFGLVDPRLVECAGHRAPISLNTEALSSTEQASHLPTILEQHHHHDLFAWQQGEHFFTFPQVISKEV